MSATPAVQLNVNAASTAEGAIKGIEGVVIELDAEKAGEEFWTYDTFAGRRCGYWRSRSGTAKGRRTVRSPPRC